ncbi:helix-turn-helix transcriptional regulator [Cytobacillus praedii]|uniref:S24 family peptidase n=1 Tax=Cytobacillus praedii TaxID=1742358 RepID=UPI002E1DF1BB|nr:S24 family peptidase [Cytobacillus praedii]
MSNLIAFEVEGNAMEPIIQEGNVVCVDPNQIPVANGKDIGVFIIGDSLHVAKYTSYGARFIMIHENAPHSVVSAASVEILGKVVRNEENHSAGNTMAIAL